ncbi:MAG: hypothetical protein HWE20_02990 [Gammaproteobacteria bacterium]|nr:hypothetical protein [Gammaproteobacteria bacterium]
MLWPESESTKANASLRQEISKLRHGFDDELNDALVTTKQTISLDPSVVKLDVDELDDYMPSEILDDFEPINDSFDQWLDLRRLSFESPADKEISVSPSPRLAVAPASDRQITLFFDAPSVITSHPLAQFFADFVRTAIMTNISEKFVAASVDRASEANIAFNLTLAGNSHEVAISMQSTLNFGLVNHLSEVIVIPTGQLGNPSNVTVNAFIGRVVERTERAVKQQCNDQTGALLGFTVINDFFDLRSDRSQQTIASLTAHQLDAPEEVTLPLLAYLATFSKGESIDCAIEDVDDRLRSGLPDLYRQQPFNSIALACLGHHAGYVDNNWYFAEQALIQATYLNPTQAFVWDHYALNRYYVGQYAAAEEAACKAVRLGVFSPLLYSYETTLSMVYTAQQRYQLGLKYAVLGMTKQPGFLALHRMKTICLMGLDQTEAAIRAFLEMWLLDAEIISTDVIKQRLASNDEALMVRNVSMLKRAAHAAMQLQLTREDAKQWLKDSQPIQVQF